MNELADLLALDELTCAECGIRFGLPPHLLAARKKDHGFLYCPNGHGLHYPEPPKERDEELEELRSALAKARDELATTLARVDQLEASARGRRRWL